MATLVTSYNPTTAGVVDTRTGDTLSFPFTARPQAMTVYVRFEERGSVLIAGARIIQIGDTSDNSPRFIILQATTGYRVHYQTASVTRTSTLAAAPVIGNIVELLATLSGAGVAQISHSINGATVVSATAAAAALLPPAWSGQTLSINSAGATVPGVIALLNLRVVRGVQDMATMRRIAGVGVR